MILNKRKDVVTNKRYERNELIRIAISKDGVTTIDKDYSIGGRGIYIHPDSIQKGIDNNIIRNNIKRFKGDYETIIKLLIEEVNNGQKK